MECEGRNLRQRMHTGVGSSRALRENALAGDAFDRLRKRALNRRTLRLNLPAAKIGAVVRERYFEIPGYSFFILVVLMTCRTSYTLAGFLESQM